MAHQEPRECEYLLWDASRRTQTFGARVPKLARGSLASQGTDVFVDMTFSVEMAFGIPYCFPVADHFIGGMAQGMRGD